MKTCLFFLPFCDNTPCWHFFSGSPQRMRSSRVGRASDCQCRSRNIPGFDPSILRHNRVWGAADEAVLIQVHIKNPKNHPVYFSRGTTNQKNLKTLYTVIINYHFRRCKKFHWENLVYSYLQILLKQYLTYSALCLCTQLSVDLMKRKQIDDGHVVMINSFSGHRVPPNASTR